MPPSVEFETPRLVAHRIGEGDVDAMLAVYGDREAMRWVGDGEPLDRAGCVRWVEVTLRNYATRGYGMWALRERASGQVIGFGGIVHPGGQPEAEIKYAFLRAAWGRGLATEAAAALLAHATGPLGLARVIATVAPANLASQRVLEKAGMARGALRSNEEGSTTQMFVVGRAGSQARPKGGSRGTRASSS